MIKNNFIISLIVFGLLSCQPIKISENIVYDYDKLPKILITAQEKIINNLYQENFSDTFIDHSMSKKPLDYLNLLFNNNINVMGAQNSLNINILDASLKRTEIDNLDAKKYQDKLIFLFEINFLVEFVLYDDLNIILANSIVESKRSTTSGKYISILESEKIINELINNCIIDFSKKTNELLKIHMKSFIF